MTIETSATDTLAESGTQPPAGNSDTQAETEEGEHQPPETISLEEARKLRAEAKSLRSRLKDFEERDRKATEAQLSEQQRLERQLAESERQLAERDRQLQERTVQAAITDAAARAGFANPALAVRLVDHAALEFDEAGAPTNVSDVLGALAKSDSYLLKPRSGGSFDTGLGGGQPRGARTYTREELRDQAFYKANETDILAAMREGRITG